MSTAARTKYYDSYEVMNDRGYRRQGRAQAALMPYTYGSAAPALEPAPRPETAPKRHYTRKELERVRNRQAARYNRERAARMNPALILFMLAVVTVMSVCLVQYVSMQLQVTSSVNEIARLESQLQSLRADNDETLSSINESVSLDDIKYRAIKDLGMNYAQKDQVVNYQNDTDDYVHQVNQIQATK